MMTSSLGEPSSSISKAGLSLVVLESAGGKIKRATQERVFPRGGPGVVGHPPAVAERPGGMASVLRPTT